MKRRKYNINSHISTTYVLSQRRLTLVAALGVTIGITIYIFLISMNSGVDRVSVAALFKSVSHIRIYKNEKISMPLIGDDKNIGIIINPRIVPESDRIVNPLQLIDLLNKQANVQLVSPQVSASVFYTAGKSQISGTIVGINEDADRMFDIGSTIVDGNIKNMLNTANSVIIGVGVAEKLNARPGDNISITSSRNVTKILKVVGLFTTKNQGIDNTKSYVNMSSAQQLLAEGPDYVSEINVNITDYNEAVPFARRLSFLTGYNAEDWMTANESVVASENMRAVLFSAISLSILLVAGFGIYNILNMTISQKMDEIAILKAMGFQGSDVIRIFVQQGVIIGLIGMLLGLLLSSLLIFLVSKIYLGGEIGFFPIGFELSIIAKGLSFGLIITACAGYIPARKAANVDPVSILRK
jgi:lipoprotein-releasing system permease protein